MPVELPPPVTPMQGTVERARHVQGSQGIADFSSHDFQVRVFGAAVLGAEQIKAAVTGADTISNGLRALVSTCYAAGYPGCRVTYTADGHDLYVLLSLEGVTAVQAAAPLGKYFENLKGEVPLTEGALERDRVLASMHADRAGLNGKLKLADDNGSAALSLDTSEGQSPNMASLEISNPGNRFVGRYFADLELGTGTSWGDEVHSFTRKSLGGDNRTHGDYVEEDLGWSRVTTWGVFAASGRYVAYEFDPIPGATIEGRLRQGEAHWQYPVLADFHTRLTPQLKLERTNKRSEVSQTGTLLQAEKYNSAEGSLLFQQVEQLAGRRWDFESGLVARKGLGNGKAQVAMTSPAPDLDYAVYRAAFVVRCHFVGNGSLALQASGQYSPDTVPEQQQLVLGGFGSLSSSLPGLAAGDSGVNVRLVGTSNSYPALGLQWQPQLYVEYGQAHFNELGGGSPGLTDAGAGLEFTRGAWFDAAVAYARPLSDKDLSQATRDGADANLYFRVKVSYGGRKP